MMGQTTADLLEIIEARRAELGWSQVDLGRNAFGKADNSVISNMKRGSAPTYDRLAAICDALGLELYVGKPRASESTILHLAEGSAETDLQTKSVFRAGYVPLPWIDPTPGAQAAPFAFALSWFESNGLIPDNLACMKPDRISVQGLDASKLLAIVDHSTAKTGYGYWAMRESGTSIARALIKDDLLIIMASDDASPPRVIDNWRSSSVRILGKVVWIGHRPSTYI